MHLSKSVYKVFLKGVYVNEFFATRIRRSYMDNKNFSLNSAAGTGRLTR
jgi:hypothetical protein